MAHRVRCERDAPLDCPVACGTGAPKAAVHLCQGARDPAGHHAAAAAGHAAAHYGRERHAGGVWGVHAGHSVPRGQEHPQPGPLHHHRPPDHSHPPGVEERCTTKGREGTPPLYHSYPLPCHAVPDVCLLWPAALTAAVLLRWCVLSRQAALPLLCNRRGHPSVAVALERCLSVYCCVPWACQLSCTSGVRLWEMVPIGGAAPCLMR